MEPNEKQNDTEALSPDDGAPIVGPAWTAIGDAVVIGPSATEDNTNKKED